MFWALPAIAAETSRLQFVTEYIRELGANENMRALAEKDMAEAGADTPSAIIRSSTRIIFELTSEVGLLKDITLDGQFADVPKNIAEFYQHKIEAHQGMIKMAEALIAGPKPGVDYDAIAAEAPKLTATVYRPDEIAHAV